MFVLAGLGVGSGWYMGDGGKYGGGAAGSRWGRSSNVMY